MRTVQNVTGQGGVQSHASGTTRTLCGRTISARNWRDLGPATANDLANVSCSRCRKVMGTLVAGVDAQLAAAIQFLEASPA